MKGLTHKVHLPSMNRDNIAEMIHWCYDNVDQTNLTWDWEWSDGLGRNPGGEFYFCDPGMLTLFALRWA